MERQMTRTRVGEDEVRYRITLRSDDCPKNTQVATFLQFELLKMISVDPALTDCGTSRFQTLKMYHNGKCWVVEAEASVKE